MMPMVFSMAPLPSLSHNDQSGVKHDSQGHWTPLIPLLCHAMLTASFCSLGEGN